MKPKSLSSALLSLFLSPEITRRFLAKVRIGKPHECWPWNGHRLGFGYGQFGVRYFGKVRNMLSHRLAWIIYNQQDVPNGMLILHSCKQTPACCNPSHLRVGNQKENIQDCIKQGTISYRKGESGPNVKLKRKQVNRIRKQYPLGHLSQRELASMFSVSQSQISNIVRYKKWN